MKVYAVIDTNVFVSALWTKHAQSATFQVVQAMQQGEIIPLYNEDILAEYKEVLSRKKFGFSEEVISDIITYICSYGIHSERAQYIMPITDENDRVFYEVALSKEDAYLVTGNRRHFPQSPIVVTPAEMLEILQR